MADPPPPERALIDDAAVARLLRWLPFAVLGHLLVGVPTLLISLVVAYGTFVQARATQHLQEAAAWPFIAYDSSNYSDEGEHRVNLVLTNNGVGPALLGPLEIRYGGKPMASPQALLAACCGYRPNSGAQIKTSSPSHVALRPGEQVTIMELADVPANRAMIGRLERERWKLDVRSCYCSIFDQCWVVRGMQATPRPVGECPADWVQYRDR